MNKVPDSINFITENLSASELEKFLSWSNLIKEEDKENAEFVIQYLHARGLESCEPRRHPEFALINAIGSTARGEREHRDIDFLFIGGGGFDEKIIFEAKDDWEIDLRLKFDYSVDHEILNEEYRPFDYRMPERSLITLLPREKGKQIHVVVQPNINTEEQWNRYDDKPRVIVDRIKNWSGGNLTRLNKIMPEMFGMAHLEAEYEQAYLELKQGHDLEKNIPLLQRAADKGLINRDTVNEVIMKGKRIYSERHRNEI